MKQTGLTIGYVRVSTLSQVEDGCSLEAQRRKIEAYCALHDLPLSEIISDEGLSAKTVRNRPGIQKVIGLVRSGKVDNVIIYRLDRMARNLRECSELAELMQKKGTALHSVTEKLDTGSATGRLFYNLLSAMGQWERELIAERTVTGMEVKRAKHERISRFAPYGYMFDNDDKLVECEQEQSVVRLIQRLRGEGYSIRGIAKFLENHGYRNRNGKPLGKNTICATLKQAA